MLSEIKNYFDNMLPAFSVIIFAELIFVVVVLLMTKERRHE